MKKLILMLVIVLGCSLQAKSQNYDNAIGLRLGYPLSVSYKQYISESNAFEIYGGFRSFAGYTQMNASAAYLIHNDIDSVDGLNWYYGFGAGAYFYSYDSSVTSSSSIALAASGYIGLEYTFADIPLSLTLDWVPTFVIGGNYAGFSPQTGSLGVRYVLAR